MPVVTPDQPLLPSLLDRLIDTEPDQSHEPLWRGSYRLEELREHVRRDLEYLLNTRHGRFDLLKDSGELAISTLTYGLPDFTGCVGGGIAERERVRAVVERAVQNFEPRLRNVHVRTHESEQEFDRDFQLTIHALLCVDPILESVSFDTIVESTTGTCEVRAS
jgi:type VI secretion system protein ImpF